MKKRDVVTDELDLANLPPLTVEERAMLERVAAMRDEDIDTSDIPEADDAFWERARRPPFVRPVKQQLTLRLDADLIAWFKARSPDGKGYQTAINRALRQHVEAHQASGGR